jgi:hypothetical protein
MEGKNGRLGLTLTGFRLGVAPAHQDDEETRAVLT